MQLTLGHHLLGPLRQKWLGVCFPFDKFEKDCRNLIIWILGLDMTSRLIISTLSDRASCSGGSNPVVEVEYSRSHDNLISMLQNRLQALRATSQGEQVVHFGWVGVLSPCKGAVSIFCSPSRQGDMSGYNYFLVSVSW